MSPPPKYYETQEFKKLSEKWEKRLDKDGLGDIVGPDGRPKNWSRDKFSRRPDWNAGKAEYFRAAGRFLYDHPFEKPIERLIWEHHANGETYNEIASFLKKSHYRPGARWVRRTVDRLSKIMLKALVS